MNSQSLPVTVVSGHATFKADLRLRVQAGAEASLDLFGIGAGLNDAAAIFSSYGDETELGGILSEFTIMEAPISEIAFAGPPESLIQGFDEGAATPALV